MQQNEPWLSKLIDSPKTVTNETVLTTIKPKELLNVIHNLVIENQILKKDNQNLKRDNLKLHNVVSQCYQITEITLNKMK
ncbi:hypothetical protein H0A36_27910 [Endozoicomonas sp. SM1973]|uniref:Uncharacterized protein n=1 Tax=Spartinivicinus marinus TaxID=2994442 RepID=A0A853IDA1_9GAMM|nr:hypothetical protein [Spartinivicinus marinus]MCX4025090.1 hypothetical protein [Spartinivicinus marinus]NYZ69842.1 hypothetical protein [Spartinivicinus marinus]